MEFFIYFTEQYHGSGGNLKVEDRAWKSNLPQAFIDAGLELGYRHIDINGKNQTGKAKYEFFCNSI